jgi:hypothetical protein
MSAPVIDTTLLLNLYRLDLEQFQGHTVARCKGCNSWVKISKHYMGDTLVLRAVPHIYPCPNYEAFIAEWRTAGPNVADGGQMVDRSIG